MRRLKVLQEQELIIGSYMYANACSSRFLARTCLKVHERLDITELRIPSHSRELKSMKTITQGQERLFLP